MDTERIEGRYVNYCKVGHNEEVFVIDYYQFFPGDDNDACDHHLRNSPKVRIIISPSDTNQLLLQLQSAIEEYDNLKNRKLMQGNPKKNERQ